MLRGIAGSIVLAAVCAATLSACHNSEDALPKPDDELQVRATLARFATASAQRDYTAVCEELLADVLTAKLRSVNVPCEAALRTGLSDVRKPKLNVTSVQVRGATATAVVRSTAKGQKPATDLVRLVKERGRWRLASLGEPRPARGTSPKRPSAEQPSARRPSAKRPSAKRPSAKRPSAKRPSAKRPKGRAPERR